VVNGLFLGFELYDVDGIANFEAINESVTDVMLKCTTFTIFDIITQYFQSIEKVRLMRCIICFPRQWYLSEHLLMSFRVC
jgi:hypothetical protein